MNCLMFAISHVSWYTVIDPKVGDKILFTQSEVIHQPKCKYVGKQAPLNPARWCA